jgi:hypothetical protein
MQSLHLLEKPCQAFISSNPFTWFCGIMRHILHKKHDVSKLIGITALLLDKFSSYRLVVLCKLDETLTIPLPLPKYFGIILK